VNALRKMSWLELKLFTREPVTVLFTLALPLLILYVLGGVFTDPAQPDEFRGVGGQNYYPPAYVGLVTASIGLIALPVHIAGYRERGVLRRFRPPRCRPSACSARRFSSPSSRPHSAPSSSSVPRSRAGTSSPRSRYPASSAFVAGVLCFAAIGFLLGALPTCRVPEVCTPGLSWAFMRLAGIR